MIGIKVEIGAIKSEIKKVALIQEKQEKLMYKLFEITPKFHQTINIENLRNGSVILKIHQ
ncbi:MAG: hypothetical protein AAF620_15805 [Bacteroidota bacterium]